MLKNFGDFLTKSGDFAHQFGDFSRVMPYIQFGGSVGEGDYAVVE